VATTTSSVALYILNNKRHFINEMETRHGIFVTVQASDKLQGANFLIEKGHAAPVATRRPDRAAVNMDWGFTGDAGEGEPVEAEGSEEEEAEPRSTEAQRGRGEEREGGRRRRRRRGRRSGEGRGEPRAEGRRGEEAAQPYDDDEADDHDAPVEIGGGQAADPGGEGFGEDDTRAHDDGEAGQAARGPDDGANERDGSENGSRRRRRGRRGGRRGRDRARGHEEEGATDEAIDRAEGEGSEPDDAAPDMPAVAAEAEEPRVPAPAREPRRRSPEPREDAGHAVPQPSEAPPSETPEPAEPVAAEAAPAAPAEPAPAVPAEEPLPAASAEPAQAPEDTVLARVRARQASSAEPKLERVVVSPNQDASSNAGAEEPVVRRGWWQRRLGG
jgi:ribonuclease E